MAGGARRMGNRPRFATARGRIPSREIAMAVHVVEYADYL
jgi:hypothetical protein